MEGVISYEKETKEGRRGGYHYSNYMRYKRLGNYPEINSWLAREREQKDKVMQALEYPDFTRDDLTNTLNSSRTETAFLEDHADMVAFFDNEYPRL